MGRISHQKALIVNTDNVFNRFHVILLQTEIYYFFRGTNVFFSNFSITRRENLFHARSIQSIACNRHIILFHDNQLMSSLQLVVTHERSALPCTSFSSSSHRIVDNAGLLRLNWPTKVSKKAASGTGTHGERQILVYMHILFTPNTLIIVYLLVPYC